MSRQIITLMAGICFPVIMFAQRTTLESQFLALETKWMNAWKEKDETTVRQILADDFTLTSSLSAGPLMTKEQWIAALPRYNCKSFSFDTVKVRKYGNTAVVNSWFKQEATANGRDWNGNFLITDVWVKRKKTWQVVSRHASWLQSK